ncbi:MAG: EamA family transporter [Chloroflexota bacterium]|nr:EamA family transporter [Chloroflexota bacterium]
MRSGHLRGYSLVLVAAALWATLGLFYELLAAYGLPPLTIVFCRAVIAALTLFLVLGWRRRDCLRLERRDWPLFVVFGLTGVAAFYAIYIYAIDLTGMGMAAVLLYTAPAWVTLFGAIFLEERFSMLKGGALLLACAGCALVSRAYDLASIRLNMVGILAGLGAGLTYGLYTLFSKIARRRYTAWTTLAYALGIGALFLLPLQSFADLAHALTTPTLLFWLMILGLVPTLGGGLAFNTGLRFVPASNASIVATLEPAIATLLGWAFLGERLETLQLLGGGLILAAVVILQRESDNQSIGQ